MGTAWSTGRACFLLRRTLGPSASPPTRTVRLRRRRPARVPTYSVYSSISKNPQSCRTCTASTDDPGLITDRSSAPARHRQASCTLWQDHKRANYLGHPGASGRARPASRRTREESHPPARSRSHRAPLLISGGDGKQPWSQPSNCPFAWQRSSNAITRGTS